MTMTRRLSFAFAILAGAGILTAIVFLTLSGIDYRIKEDKGLDPGHSPPWIVAGIELGLWASFLSVLALIAIGSTTLLRRRQLNRPRKDHTNE